MKVDFFGEQFQINVPNNVFSFFKALLFSPFFPRVYEYTFALKKTLQIIVFFRDKQLGKILEFFFASVNKSNFSIFLENFPIFKMIKKN
jgi:hypothetical protein